MMHKNSFVIVAILVTAALTAAVPIDLTQLPVDEVQAMALPSQAVEAVDVGCQVSAFGAWSSCSKTCGGGSQTRQRTVTQTGNNCPSLQESQSCNTQECHIATVDFGKTVLASLEANMQKLTATNVALKAVSDKAAVSAAAAKDLLDAASADLATKKASMESSMAASVVASKQCSSDTDAEIAAAALKTQAINAAKDTSAIDKELALIAQLKAKLVEVFKLPRFAPVSVCANMVTVTHNCAVDERQKFAANGKSANVSRRGGRFHSGCY
jgi:hypothetical protein